MSRAGRICVFIMAISTFNAFRSRNYRLYFTGQSISLIGTWMQKTAVSWVIYSLTHSKFMLGLTLFASMFPSFLFSFIGGVVSDRYDRYKLLLLTQVVSMIQAILLTLLIFFRHYTVWQILALSVLLGIINAFDVPARQSLVYDMVDDKKDLPNAVALNSSMVNLSRLIGPGIAGLIIEKFGDGVCFGLNALSFVAVLLVLPFSTLIPVYAKDIFHGTASTFGVIDSVIGLGAFSGAIFLASLKPGINLRKILAINTFVFGCGLALFSHTTLYPLALIFAAIAAFGMMSQITISNTLIQTTVDPAMRGRVISIYAMAFFGMQPLGGLIIGFMSQHIGVENTLLAEGITALLIGVLHVRFLRKRKSKRNPVPVLRKQPAETTIPV